MKPIVKLISIISIALVSLILLPLMWTSNVVFDIPRFTEEWYKAISGLITTFLSFLLLTILLDYWKREATKDEIDDVIKRSKTIMSAIICSIKILKEKEYEKAPAALKDLKEKLNKILTIFSKLNNTENQKIENTYVIQLKHDYDKIVEWFDVVNEYLDDKSKKKPSITEERAIDNLITKLNEFINYPN